MLYLLHIKTSEPCQQMKNLSQVCFNCQPCEVSRKTAFYTKQVSQDATSFGTHRSQRNPGQMPEEPGLCNKYWGCRVRLKVRILAPQLAICPEFAGDLTDTLILDFLVSETIKKKTSPR